MLECFLFADKSFLHKKCPYEERKEKTYSIRVKFDSGKLLKLIEKRKNSKFASYQDLENI